MSNTGWQPIKTAPRDGNDILLYWRADDAECIDMCFFDNGGFVLACECRTGIQRWQPGYTHWMHLPEPPS